MGFMGYLGQRLGGALGGLPWPAAYAILVVAYVLLHYLFVSQTAHVLALFGVFLGSRRRSSASRCRSSASPCSSRRSYMSTITPQASSANVLVVGSGYLTQGELYRLGTITTAFNILLLLLVGTPWLMLVAR